MTETPRIRGDLSAVPVEEEGYSFYDVSDPRSGASLRLYDFEWFIAAQMDGTRRFDEIAAWAQQFLAFSPTAADIEAYAARLGELGFFELLAEASVPTRDTPAVERAPAEAAPEVTTTLETDVPIEAEAAAPADPEELSETEIAIDAEPTNSEPSMVPVSDDDEPTQVGATPFAAAAPPEAPMPPPTSARPESEAVAKTLLAPAPAPVVPKPAPVELTPPAAPAPARPAPVPAAAEAKPSLAEPVTPPPPRRSSAASLAAIVVVLLGIAGAVGYMTVLNPTAQVTVVMANPRDVVRLFDGAGQVKRVEPQTLSFGEGGRVTDVMAKDTQVTAGMPVATLEAFTKIEKDLADVKDRAGFYEKQLQAAKAKGAEDEIKKAEAKVAEKKRLITDLEQRAGKLRLLAPSSGTITEVLVAVGAEVQAGAPVARIGNKRLSVELKVPADEAPKPGAQITLELGAGGTTVAGRVDQVAGEQVTIELPEDTAAKEGDSLRLVKKKEANVISLPASALIGEDSVFVVVNGEAKLRKVVVAERVGSAVLIRSGLSAGDAVVTDGGAGLKDGQKASYGQK